MIHDLGDNLIPALAISFTFLFLITWVIMATIDSLYKTARNAKLKETLIARNVSADEIARIINSGTSYQCVEPPSQVVNRPAPPVKYNRPHHV